MVMIGMKIVLKSANKHLCRQFSRSIFKRSTSVQNMSNFKEKVVIVTGASSGIGEATAKDFARCGANLALTGRNEQKLNEVAEDCKINGSNKVVPMIAKFESLAEVRKVYDATIAAFGKINVLVNNAGDYRAGTLENAKMEEFDHLFQVHVKSVLHLSQLAMPHLVESKGNIVTVSSISSTQPTPSRLMYGMAKAAVDQFTRTVALEYASKGVRVNAVNPSNVRTNIVRERGWTAERIEQHYAKSAARHPMGRVGNVQDVASLIAFLASEEASWITGQCMILDGGISLAS